MALDTATDVRLDPRLRSILAAIPSTPQSDVQSREELLAEANSPGAEAFRATFRSFQDLCDTEEAAPSTGLTVTTRDIESQPDGNTIRLQIIRPESTVPTACV